MAIDLLSHIKFSTIPLLPLIRITGIGFFLVLLDLCKLKCTVS
jgi:hypothetical protein